MEHVDPQAAGDIWRRVMMGPPGDSGVEALCFPALEALADYRLLTNLLGGRARREAEGLQARQRETVDILRGLAQLTGRENPHPQLPIPGKGNARACIQRSYHRARRAAAEYTARTADPLTGAAFRVLAGREEENCAALAGMMGMM